MFGIKYACLLWWENALVVIVTHSIFFSSTGICDVLSTLFIAGNVVCLIFIRIERLKIERRMPLLVDIPPHIRNVEKAASFTDFTLRYLWILIFNHKPDKYIKSEDEHTLSINGKHMEIAIVNVPIQTKIRWLLFSPNFGNLCLSNDLWSFQSSNSFHSVFFYLIFMLFIQHTNSPNKYSN